MMESIGKEKTQRKENRGREKRAVKKNLGLYVHIPFCKKKCAYCDFLSFVSQESGWRDYVGALLQEIGSFEEKSDYLREHYVTKTVFIGGGTPSLLPPIYIEEIMVALRNAFPFAGKEEMEITIEANPGTLTEEKLKSYQSFGINRLSLGLQSTDQDELKLLGRIHSYEVFRESFQMAREAGFCNINIDIMSALPGQTLSGLENTVVETAALSPEHISAYSLIIEEGTPFHEKYSQHPELLVSEEVERSMYQRTSEILSQYGYERYEISNYCKKGYACIHNLSYWDGTDYIGMGLGAASLFETMRFTREKELSDYISLCARAAGRGYDVMADAISREREVLTQQDKIEEFMFLGLRKIKGVSKNEFLQRFGCHMEAIYGDVMLKHTEGGFLIEEGDRLKLSSRGIDVSNIIMSDFLL